MKTVRLLAALLGLALSTPARAGALPDGGVTAAEVAAVMQAKGLKAEIAKDKDGDPMIVSGVDGTTFRVLFYGCKSTSRCAAIQFATGIDLPDGLTLETINDWNRKNRFGRAYLDEEMDPYLQMDMDLEHGATTEAVGANLDTWAVVLPAFKAYIRK